MRETLGFLAVVAGLAQWKVTGDDFGLDFSVPGGTELHDVGRLLIT